MDSYEWIVMSGLRLSSQKNSIAELHLGVLEVEKLQNFRLRRAAQYSITRHESLWKQLSGYGNLRFRISLFEFLYLLNFYTYSLNFYIRWI